MSRPFAPTATDGPGPPLPAPVAALADDLAGLPGAVAVVLGGSRATGTHRPDSDWDLGVYYRPSERSIDPEDVRGLGRAGMVSELGEWGPIMNGGAWLSVDGMAVDVLFRDLDAVERWLRAARRGQFEVLSQNGYLAGAPTYLPVAELAIGRPISGELPRPGFPEELAARAPGRWRGRAAVALLFADQHAAGGDPLACIGMLANAVLCAAHARLAERRGWLLNEKGLVRRAGLDGTGTLLPAPGAAPTELAKAVTAVAGALGIEPLRIP